LKQTIMNDINDAYNDDRKYYCKSKKQIVWNNEYDEMYLTNFICSPFVSWSYCLWDESLIVAELVIDWIHLNCRLEKLIRFGQLVLDHSSEASSG
jgi:hypothetical protein